MTIRQPYRRMGTPKPTPESVAKNTLADSVPAQGGYPEQEGPVSNGTKPAVVPKPTA